MNTLEFIKNKTNIPFNSIENTIKLLDQDCTIPFIARYRKEATNNLDEVQIMNIFKHNQEFIEIQKRKEFVLSSIEEQGFLTEDLKNKIQKSFDLVQIEDLYLPFKKKRKTKASIAKENGLEPLAEAIFKQNITENLDNLAAKYINENVNSLELVFQGANDIIAEWISENEIIRNRIRNVFKHEALIKSEVVKTKKEDENAKKYALYFDFSEPLKRCASHRLLAILRAEKEGFLKVNISVDEHEIIEIIERNIIKTNNQKLVNFLQNTIKDSYKRLLFPSISNESIQLSKKQADLTSVSVFAKNLNQLLLAPPLGQKRVLAIDPGFRTGCKIVCLDEKGDLLHNETIYPHEPQNKRIEASKKLNTLVQQYKIDAISIGNGTASRETENLVKKTPFNKDVKVFVVNEAGASIYSASKVARDEFPNYDVTVRGAVSIGRRLQDPLAELVKIDPKSIGVGQYQHDVDQTILKNELDNEVMLCVNKIGVNLNTASKELLQYVSGIGEKMAENIVKHRAENGVFSSRKDLKKVNRLGEKAFQQASAFLRIPSAENPLDNSAVHPESYFIAEKMAKDLKVKINDLISNKELIKNIKIENYINDSFGKETIKDILKELEKPGLDPRKEAKVFSYDPRLKTINDVKIGMKLPGIITNITNFGCFVSIGIKENGLIHVSKITNEFITDISSKVFINQEVIATVIDVDVNQKRIQLSLID